MASELGHRQLSLDDLLTGLRRGGEPEGSLCAEELIRRFTPMLRSVWRKIKGTPDYRDFVQDVFVRVFRYLPDLRDATLFPGYFHRVASSVAIDHLRRTPSGKRAEDVDLNNIVSKIAAEDEILNSLFVGSYLNRLGWKHRRVLELLYLEDQPDTAVAAALGLQSSGSVRKLKSQAIKELRMIVEAQRS